MMNLVILQITIHGFLTPRVPSTSKTVFVVVVDAMIIIIYDDAVVVGSVVGDWHCRVFSFLFTPQENMLHHLSQIAIGRKVVLRSWQWFDWRPS